MFGRGKLLRRKERQLPKLRALDVLPLLSFTSPNHKPQQLPQKRARSSFFALVEHVTTRQRGVIFLFTLLRVAATGTRRHLRGTSPVNILAASSPLGAITSLLGSRPAQSHSILRRSHLTAVRKVLKRSREGFSSRSRHLRAPANAFPDGTLLSTRPSSN